MLENVNNHGLQHLTAVHLSHTVNVFFCLTYTSSTETEANREHVPEPPFEVFFSRFVSSMLENVNNHGLQHLTAVHLSHTVIVFSL